MDSTQLLKIENGRAEHAFEKAKKASENEDKKFVEEYNSYVKKLPMLIKTNGLGSSFAFMMAKNGTYVTIGNDIVDWLRKGGKVDSNSVSNLSEFVSHIVTVESTEYRLLTSEVLAYLEWLKRFSDGFDIK